jgi:transcriptional regulator with XRE-family HTH domain
MKSLGQFILDRRRELGLSGRELVAGIKKSDGKPISIPYLVDLEHDRRKPSDEVLVQMAKVLQVDSDLLYYLAGRMPPDLAARKNLRARGFGRVPKAAQRESRKRQNVSDVEIWSWELIGSQSPKRFPSLRSRLSACLKTNAAGGREIPASFTSTR